MSKHFAHDVNNKPVSAIEFVDLILGKKIGSGMSRDVYDCLINDNYVIKHETGSGFQNIIEWEIWRIVKDTPEKKWFAPCHYISPNGLFLIQEKIDPCPKKKFPTHVPAFFTDLKYQNFGLIGKQFVCFDYGTILSCNLELSKRTKKADWWDDKG